VHASFVIAIFGPTASGKTAVAEEVASRIPSELVSADSMQAYKGLPVLTNQPVTPTQLVGIWALDHEGSVAEYAEAAHKAVDEALAAARTPVVVGGTGLYLRAALAELDVPPSPGPEQRRRWEEHYDRVGPEQAHAELAERDPGAAAAVHPNDRRRIVRALELAELGHTLKPERDTLWTEETRHPTAVFGLDVPRELLEFRIEERTRAMFEAGVEDEVREALEHPISATAQQMMGLTEVAELPKEEAIAAIAERTRAYASYQRKWMRRIPGLVSLPGERPPGDLADAILEVARTRQRLPARRAG
jgi:tRNA dimethylallyltransferase